MISKIKSHNFRCIIRAGTLLVALPTATEEKAFGPDHPNTATVVNNLGGVLRGLGDLDGARKAYQRALAIDEKVFGPDHPYARTVRNNLAVLEKASSHSGQCHNGVRASGRPLASAIYRIKPMLTKVYDRRVGLATRINGPQNRWRRTYENPL